MNIDPKKAKQLGCSATCSVSLLKRAAPTGEQVSTHELPSTPHRAGLCVVLISANQTPVLRVTHVRSGFALDLEHSDYPATKVGMAAALHELELLLPITDWTRSADDLADIKVAADVIVQRCRRAFPGKLVGNVFTRDIAEPPPEIVKWRVYSQDTATGEWSFVELAHEDHLLDAVDQALTKFDGPNSWARRDVPVATTPYSNTEHHAFDFDHSLLVCRNADGVRIVIVEPSLFGFDLCCEQRTALIEKLAQAERELRGVDNPRRTLGVWKSGPKFGQLKLSVKLPPEQCVEMLAQQERYDAAARKVEAIKTELHWFDRLLAESKPIPERVTKLCPRETPDGKADAIKLLAMLRVQDIAARSSRQFMFGKCIAQLEKGLREYESVELHGFAPRSRCMFVGDPRDCETDCEVEVEDVIVSRGERWHERQNTELRWWWHERDVINVNTCERFCVAVSRLQAVL